MSFHASTIYMSTLSMLMKVPCHAFTPTMYMYFYCTSNLSKTYTESIKSPPLNPIKKDVVFSSMFNIINKYKKINSKENNSLVCIWSCLFVSHQQVHEIVPTPSCRYKAGQLVMRTDHSEGESLSCPSDPLDHCPWAEKHIGILSKQMMILFK